MELSFPVNEYQTVKFRRIESTEKRTAEPQNIEYRMSKGGFALLSLF